MDGTVTFETSHSSLPQRSFSPLSLVSSEIELAAVVISSIRLCVHPNSLFKAPHLRRSPMPDGGDFRGWQRLITEIRARIVGLLGLSPFRQASPRTPWQRPCPGPPWPGCCNPARISCTEAPMFPRPLRLFIQVSNFAVRIVTLPFFWSSQSPPRVFLCLLVVSTLYFFFLPEPCSPHPSVLAPAPLVRCSAP